MTVSSRHLLSLLLCIIASARLVHPSSALVEIRRACLPADLPQIRDCRRTAFPEGAQLLGASKSFINADQIQRENIVCVVAEEKSWSASRVLGTADVDVDTNTVNNVFVREDARGRGLGRSLMEGVEGILDRPVTLSLQVDTQNTPAVGLYQSLGFEARGIHALVSGLSAVTSWSLQVKMTKHLD
mmetsp:Transcript_10908/g.32293  ORF Transcript_10908/g.32293 Transcript_10908/m.32293 type:complete len:185 (-) Transcript_10908:545-1099(-)|eukprot:CAMPEP_0113533782 /NCGR_PEP_ID=MMETSP0015_2-20120614/4800_1 /TAXON_ID=2838 /ORGANISM="Odontella" /LENGTH=184 /DNA_ID=CAMNT_0000432881 /DNA_START=141 /DNA_END=695 /DNA_ORIENTATION=+ /assembly_acc=CAM_ASM_000160